LGAPVVAENADGRMEVFVRSTDWQLWHIWQTAPNNGWSNWAGDLLVTNAFECPGVGQNADGRLEMFGNGFWLGALQHQWQTWPNLIWSSWNTSSDRDLGGIHTSTPVIAQNAGGRIEVFEVSNSKTRNDHYRIR